MVLPGNNSANYGNQAVWSGTSRPTTVGTNGGPSYYGTYDQNGNISELAISGNIKYSLGGNFATADPLVLSNSNSNIYTDAYGTASAMDGFRLFGENYTNIQISSTASEYYDVGSGIYNSFYITNYENFKVTGIIISVSYNGITNQSWNCNYTTNSSGTASGSGNIYVLCDIEASGTANINFSGISSSGKLIFVNTINLYVPSGYKLQQNNHFSIMKASASSSILSTENYTSKFKDLNWGNITPNSFVNIEDFSNPNFYYSSSSIGEFLGSIPYYYSITKYHITNNEYCLFLNSIDPQGTNPQSIYNSSLQSGTIVFNSGNINGSKYTVVTSPYYKGNKAVDNITVLNMLKYCNWLSNGAASYALTSSGINAPQNNGSYNVGTGINLVSIPKPTGRFRLPNCHEFFKSSFYKRDPLLGSVNGYWYFGTQSDTTPDSIYSGISPHMDGIFPINNYSNSANYGASMLTTAGTNGAPNAYGIYDVDGCVYTVLTHYGTVTGIYYYVNGSSWKSTTAPVGNLNNPYYNFSNISNTSAASSPNAAFGFRVVSSGRYGDLSLDISSPSIYIESTGIVATATLNNESFYQGSGSIRLNISGSNIINSGYWSLSYYGGSYGPSILNNNTISSGIILPQGSYVIANLTNCYRSLLATTPVFISGSIVNTDLIDLVSENNNDSLLLVINPQTYLNISVSGSQSIAKNNPLDYSILLSNTGSSYVAGISLYANFGSINNIPNFSWQKNASSSGATATVSSGTGNISTIVSLLPYETCLFNVSGTFQRTLDQINISSSFSVTGNQIGSGSSTLPTYFQSADLNIFYSGLPSYYENSQYVNYYIIINNSGYNDSNNVQLVHSSSGLSGIQWNINYDQYSSGVSFGSGNINIPILIGSSGQVSVNVFGYSNSSGSEDILLQSSLTASTTPDNNSGNNTISTTIPHSFIIRSIQQSDGSCGDNGYVRIKSTGGVPPFSYNLGSKQINSSLNDITIKNLEPGTYNLYVRDSANFTYYNPDNIELANNSIVVNINDIYSPVLLDSYGIVNLSVVGKIASYTFVFTDSNDRSVSVSSLETKYIVSSEQDDQIGTTINYRFDDLLTPGEYNYLIQDPYGCKTSGSFEIPNILEITAQISTIDDSPINTSIATLSLDIFDTILIPYKHIKNNTSLWNSIKKLNLKDYISILINDVKYEFRIVRDMLDKNCVDTTNSIELLKLGNSEEDWYYFFYIAPSLDLTNDQTNISSSLQILDSNSEEKFFLTLGLLETNELDNENASLIRGSFILNGLGYNEYVDNSTAYVSIGYNENDYNYFIKNIKKSTLNNIYNVGFVTTINFLEQFNILKNYITIGDTACNMSQEEYQYKLNIKNLLIDMNNFNNINNLYIFNGNSISHNGQLNVFVFGNDTFITESQTINNIYNIEYFTFDASSNNLKYFEINNKTLKDTNVISGLDSRYVIVRIKDIYNNIPKIVNLNGVLSSYDNHFIESQRAIQNYNSSILEQFEYGDILIFIKDSTYNYSTTLGLDPVTGLPGTVTLPGTNNISASNIIEQTKDTSDTGSLLIKIPSKINTEIFGPNNYFKQINTDTLFKNLIPGIYIIKGNIDSLKENNLYQNELRILVSKNLLSTVTIDFTSYANKLFIKD
jgi:hypothetical protein